MKFTKEIPTVPGWYWFREPGEEAGIKYFSDTLTGFLATPGPHGRYDEACDYAGPIPNAEEVD